MKMEKRNNLLTMEKLLYIIIILLLVGCSKKNTEIEYPDIIEFDKYYPIKKTDSSSLYGRFVYDSHTYHILCVNATNLIDIKEELQTLNSNIIELINKK